MSNSIVVGNIIRNNEDVDNDITYAEPVNKNLPVNKSWREYYWPVKDYIWEFEEVRHGEYKIKLIADDKDPMYLSFNASGITLSPNNGPVWKKIGGCLQAANNMYLAVESGNLKLQKDKYNLSINI